MPAREAEEVDNLKHHSAAYKELFTGYMIVISSWQLMKLYCLSHGLLHRQLSSLFHNHLHSILHRLILLS